MKRPNSATQGGLQPGVERSPQAPPARTAPPCGRAPVPAAPTAVPASRAAGPGAAPGRVTNTERDSRRRAGGAGSSGTVIPEGAARGGGVVAPPTRVASAALRSSGLKDGAGPSRVAARRRHDPAALGAESGVRGQPTALAEEEGPRRSRLRARRARSPGLWIRGRALRPCRRRSPESRRPTHARPGAPRAQRQAPEDRVCRRAAPPGATAPGEASQRSGTPPQPSARLQAVSAPSGLLAGRPGLVV